MGKKNAIPSGWEKYSKIGTQIPGTRFIAFKVPLKEEICRRKLLEDEWFTPAHALKCIPDLKLVVNLTNTEDGRYYNKVDFNKEGINILPLKCIGRGTLPPERMLERFFRAVDDFMRTTATDNNSLIGVHCTHGLNRTGYFICSYMVNRMGMTADEAINLFETARGHPIERQQYINEIKRIESVPLDRSNSAQRDSDYFSRDRNRSESYIQRSNRPYYDNNRQHSSRTYSNYQRSDYSNWRSQQSPMDDLYDCDSTANGNYGKPLPSYRNFGRNRRNDSPYRRDKDTRGGSTRSNWRN